MLAVLAAAMGCVAALGTPEAHARGGGKGKDRQEPPRFIQVKPSMGVVSFQQVLFEFDAIQTGPSDWGQIDIDTDRVRELAPDTSYYLNVLISSSRTGQPQWVLDNIFVPAAPCDAPPASGPRRSVPICRYLDLAPQTEIVRQPIQSIFATVLATEQPIPVAQTIQRQLSQFPRQVFQVTPTVVNAEGFLPDPLLNTRPPRIIDDLQPVGPAPKTSPAPTPNQDLVYPMCIIQDAAPNIQTARNQCVPMAVANTIQYLEDRYNGGLLAWDLPELPVPGYGQQFLFGDNVFWQPVQPFSVIAQVDASTSRLGAVSFDEGSGSNICQLYTGLFEYLDRAGPFTDARFKHQGTDAEMIGAGTVCDDISNDLGDRVSVREGTAPTWQWIFDELTAGHGVLICFGYYDAAGNRTGGHCVRVYGACRVGSSFYLYTLDDSIQGTNSVGLRTQQIRVEDTGGPGDPGNPNGQLNIDDTTWEIEFALSIEARPTLFVP